MNHDGEGRRMEGEDQKSQRCSWGGEGADSERSSSSRTVRAGVTCTAPDSDADGEEEKPWLLSPGQVPWNGREAWFKHCIQKEIQGQTLKRKNNLSKQEKKLERWRWKNYIHCFHLPNGKTIISAISWDWRDRSTVKGTYCSCGVVYKHP